MHRLEEKRHFIDSIEENIKNQAVPIQSFPESAAPLYSKVTLSGTFLTDKSVYLYGRRSASPEKDGYYLLTPFAADNGEVYFVSRGWAPQSVKDKMEAESYTRKTIEAMVMSGEKKNFFVPENDQKNNIWFTLDLDMAKKLLRVSVADFYLMQINSQNLPKGAKPLATTYLNKVHNNHLEYAITWYSLAACLFVMFMIYGRKPEESST